MVGGGTGATPVTSPAPTQAPGLASTATKDDPLSSLDKIDWSAGNTANATAKDELADLKRDRPDLVAVAGEMMDLISDPRCPL